MLKLVHSCGYEEDFENPCPKCGLPFCEEDTQQATGGIMVTVIDLKKKLNQLRTELNQLKAKINSCPNCK